MKLSSALPGLAAGMVVFLGNGSSAANAANAADAAFDRRFAGTFLEEYWKLWPDQAIAAGYYRVADDLVVPDAQARARRQHFLETWLARVRAVKADALDPAHRTDRLILILQLEGRIWQLTTYRDWQWDPSVYNVAEPFALLLNTGYAPVEERLRHVLRRLADVPAYYAAARASIEDPTPEHTALAIDQNKGTLEVFGRDLEDQIAQANLSPPERALFRARIDAAREAVQHYIDSLLMLDPAHRGAARSFRIGEALYEQKFRYQIANGSAARALYERAVEEKEAVLGRMDVLTGQLWPKYFPNAAMPADRSTRIRTLIDKLSEQHIPRDRMFETVKSQISMLEEFVTRHNLLTLDPSKPLEVRITPTYKLGIASASLDAPGPYDPGARTYYNVTPLDTLTAAQAESTLREYNNWMLPILSIHEAVPGHYVQLSYANRSPSLIKSVFANDAMVEGWAVYGERMMMEAGFGDDTAEQWLIYSKWNLRSVVNTILDYAVHTQNMSEADAMRLLTQEAFQADQEAREKWHRVQVTSVQLTSYFAGYSAIYDLRERLKREHPQSFDLRKFHERFLSYGSAPVGLIADLIEGGANGAR